jgi:hypothetical protein
MIDVLELLGRVAMSFHETPHTAELARGHFMSLAALAVGMTRETASAKPGTNSEVSCTCGGLFGCAGACTPAYGICDAYNWFNNCWVGHGDQLTCDCYCPGGFCECYMDL